MYNKNKYVAADVVLDSLDEYIDIWEWPINRNRSVAAEIPKSATPPPPPPPSPEQQQQKELESKPLTNGDDGFNVDCALSKYKRIETPYDGRCDLSLYRRQQLQQPSLSLFRPSPVPSVPAAASLSYRYNPKRSYSLLLSQQAYSGLPYSTTTTPTTTTTSCRTNLTTLTTSTKPVKKNKKQPINVGHAMLSRPYGTVNPRKNLNQSFTDVTDAASATPLSTQSIEK